MVKNILLTLTLVVCVGFPAIGQSKKELKAQVDILQAQIREMQATNDAMVFENKALRKRIEMIRYYVLEMSDNLPVATTYESTSGQASTSTSNTTSSSYSRSRTSSTTSSYSSSYSGSAGRTIYTGPRGGRYYINSKGNKVYLKRK